MNKVIVIGCPGAGKSTFARQLNEKTQIPLFYLDMIWHRADKTTVSREQFDFGLIEIMKQDRWIIDGNYIRTIPIRLQQCDTVFLLDYERNGNICVNVKVDPEWRDFWRSAYASVLPGYHQNKEHWNTIILDGSIPDDEVKRMVAESYDLIVKK